MRPRRPQMHAQARRPARRCGPCGRAANGAQSGSGRTASRSTLSCKRAARAATVRARSRPRFLSSISFIPIQMPTSRARLHAGARVKADMASARCRFPASTHAMSRRIRRVRFQSSRSMAGPACRRLAMRRAPRSAWRTALPTRAARCLALALANRSPDGRDRRRGVARARAAGRAFL
ncbi:hypothetical protein F9948_11180 [Burkholderia thailandensis]|nr:hypothetical protein [Burkholderia thailandensis]MDD1489253.1 hypothetical protein [Burkholderia thailandensis]MDD1493794.1 hypothetical protein [Burkholderia thailandensis]